MAEWMEDKTKTEVRKMLEGMVAPVSLVLFTQAHACPACREQKAILETLAGLSAKVSLEVHDLVAEGALARRYGIDKVPATAVAAGKDDGIRFYGVTAGYEFPSLLEAVLLASRGASGLPDELAPLLQLIDEPVHLEVMVTLTCPYCPKMVHLAHQLAVANPLIRADMVESSAFPHLVQRYQVTGVPRTVVNEVHAFDGALPAPEAILEILKAVKPRVYDEIEAKLREARGERRAREADPERLYDAVIVGAGPAAMSAAIYAVRKNLDILVLGEEAGGQITGTARVENWLGVPEASGRELAAAFRRHMERYAVAERLGVQVTRIDRTPEGFRVVANPEAAFEGRTVIYCAGKRYRRLGVPGESRFLGRGIAFCATCDAPLFRDKAVAVVGGGNSAFTAARDLLPYAAGIHVINILPDFQADPALVDEVRRSPRVKLHGGMQVREFLGQDQLSGIRVEAVDGSRRMDLRVEGVFLEIGLVPNTKPVEHLLDLNDRGEIPADRDQSTAVPGLFAAGDATDETEKQMVVAAGAGAKAALAAHRYLLDRRAAGI